MKVYRAKGFGMVRIHGDVGPPTFLSPRFDIARISPTGFGWGYDGPGSQQLAVALICDVTGNHLAALEYYSELTKRLLARMNRDAPLEVTEQSVKDCVLRIDDDRKAAARA